MISTAWLLVAWDAVRGVGRFARLVAAHALDVLDDVVLGHPSTWFCQLVAGCWPEHGCRCWLCRHLWPWDFREEDE